MRSAYFWNGSSPTLHRKPATRTRCGSCTPIYWILRKHPAHRLPQSPEPASGKTRALEATELLVPRAVEAINVSPAYLFRKVGAPEGRPTILFDEIDTVFGPKARDNEEIRGLLNAGHRRSGVAGRCVVRGKIVETEEIPAYCAVALAGLGWLPDTILSRSIIIRMRRRAPDETVEPFRRREAEPMGTGLKKRIAAWAAKNAKTIEDARPDMPVGIEDRNADVWEPLIAIADAAGGEWPRSCPCNGCNARNACSGGEPTEPRHPVAYRHPNDLRHHEGHRQQSSDYRSVQYGRVTLG